MRRGGIIVAVVAAMLGTSVPASASLLFQATLNAAQEVGGSTSTAVGTATAILNDAEDSLTILINFVGLELADVTRAHIHSAPAGSNGGIVFGFIDPNHDLDGDLVTFAFPGGGFIGSVWDGAEGNGTTLAAELANLKADGLYVNIHTANNPGGAIRGQLLLVPEPGSLALLGLGAASMIRRRRRA